jgi:hypothetical protein
LAIALAQPNLTEQDAKHLIVMVTAQYSDKAKVGAGIYFGQTADQFYFFTANHVVREPLEDAKVFLELLTMPNQPVEAILLEKRNNELDIAVVGVNKNQLSPSTVTDLESRGLTLVDLNSLNRGDELFSIGNTNQRAWSTTSANDFAELELSTLNFQTYTVASGTSGGGLFTKDWELVGMVVNTEMVVAQAIRIDRLVELYELWFDSQASFAPEMPKPCQAKIKISSAEGALLNQVRVLPRNDAPSRPPAIQGSLVTILEKNASGWVRISYSQNVGWVEERFLENLPSCFYE